MWSWALNLKTELSRIERQNSNENFLLFKNCLTEVEPQKTWDSCSDLKRLLKMVTYLNHWNAQEQVIS